MSCYEFKLEVSLDSEIDSVTDSDFRTPLEVLIPGEKFFVLMAKQMMGFDISSELSHIAKFVSDKLDKFIQQPEN